MIHTEKGREQPGHTTAPAETRLALRTHKAPAFTVYPLPLQSQQNTQTQS